MTQTKVPQTKKAQHNKSQTSFLVVLIAFALLVAAAAFFYFRNNNSTAQVDVAYPAPGGGLDQPEEVKLSEMPVTEIALAGVGSDASAEYSGLAWYGDSLILLPQYPNIFTENGGDGSLFYLPKNELTLYINGAQGSPLQLRSLKLIAPDLTNLVPNYQGFESIAFSGDKVFLTIEAGEGKKMMGYLISGTINPDLSALTLDTTKLTKIPPQAKSENHSDESILIMNDKIFTFYEANGVDIVSKPVAHVFDFDLTPQGTVPMSNLEFRLTDTTPGFFGNDFWGINYFFPGDTDLLPKNDPILSTYGTGETHAKFPQVERVINFQYTEENGITIANRLPIYLTLTEDIRNWEGLAMLDKRGFIMVTDKYPRTILAFVPIPR